MRLLANLLIVNVIVTDMKVLYIWLQYWAIYKKK